MDKENGVTEARTDGCSEKGMEKRYARTGGNWERWEKKQEMRRDEMDRQMQGKIN